MTKAINSINFGAAFAAMDRAASQFWTYPDADWQEGFLRQWAENNDDKELLEALGD